ncbi:MAG: pyrroline-5-carboxylate reductase [Halioglobus sp.]
MNTPRIAFIGAGNMATSIVGGLLDSGHPPEMLSAADPFPDSLVKLAERGPVVICNSNAEAAAHADVIILAVKPQVMAEAVASIADAAASNGALVISIAAGVTIDAMQAHLGGKAPIVRCMPNTPALLGCGASGLFASSSVSEQQKQHAQAILAAVGIVRWVPSEEALDTVTALSGSGPAYYFLMMEAMINAACELGLDREAATELTTQTALGAARMAQESDVDLVELRRRVTSPAGTTERAVNSLEDDQLRAIIARAMQAAQDRAAEMAKDLG